MAQGDDGGSHAADPTRAISDLDEVLIAEPGAVDPTRAISDLDEVVIPEPDSAAASPAQSDAWIGRVLDARYRLTGVIGEGGFGFVFRAKHLILGRDVAVKILQSADGGDPLERARFERESSMLAALAHPHIVTVTDFGVSERVPYLVMELVDGQSLRALMDRGELDPERTLRIVVQILKALAYAHEHGIVHRDLKPANVLVQRHGGDDHATLLDFGFAKFFGESERRPHNSLTAHGTAFGTTGYIAPEQLGSAPIDGRVDLYATAVIVFEAIAGRRPFHVPGANAVEELRATLITPAPSLAAARPELPLCAALDPLLQRALAK
ncbi:MAG: serine/threonine protein kinase, partial [Myxococcota bacterium]|nr:serine/threonine protein kinase [Myxococcota bacterium]